LLSSLLLTACAGQPPQGPDGSAYPRLMQLAQDVERRGDAGTAATLYQRATEQPDAGFDAWYRLGETRLATGDARGAEQAFQQALGQRPEDPAARLGLGTAQLRLGAASQAEPLLRDAAQALGSATAFNRLAIANVQLGHLQAAQQAFLRASRAAPADLDARCNLALSYALSGQNHQALQTVEGLDRAANVLPRQQRNVLLVRVLAGQTDAELQTVNLERADAQRRPALIAEARQLAAIADTGARAAAIGWDDRR
jgi:Flp pilus assembly protein TadD